MTARNGSTIRMSERSIFRAFSRAVISAITRKMLNSSLAAVKLALKMLPSAVTGLCVQASVTRNVATTDGTTTLARRIIVRHDDGNAGQIDPVRGADAHALAYSFPVRLQANILTMQYCILYSKIAIKIMHDASPVPMGTMSR